MNIATGEIMVTNHNSYTITTDKVIQSDGWTADLPSAMVIPFANSTQDTEFEFVVDGKTYTVNVPVKSFNRGDKYIFNLTIKSATMELDANNITIAPWGTEQKIDLDAVVTKVKGLAYTVTTTAANQTMPVANVGNVTGTIDWGDGVSENYVSSASHSYPTAGTYNVQVASEDAITDINITSVEKIDEVDLSQLG